MTADTLLTEEIRDVIGGDQLVRMKRTAVRVDVSRGGAVDEKALYEALNGKQVAGAALDVFATERRESSLLFEFDNFIGTPHPAGYTIEGDRGRHGQRPWQSGCTRRAQTGYSRQQGCRDAVRSRSSRVT